MDLSEPVKELEAYFDKPVVLQLKVPTAAIGNDGTTVSTPDGELPVPKLESNPDGSPITLMWLVGVLKPDPTGRHVVLTINSPVHDARTCYRIAPADIQYVMTVVRAGHPEAPKERNRIISPH